MKHTAYLLVIAVIAISVASCATPYGQPDYTASCAVIGSLTRDPAAGVLGGGAVGAVVGGLIGHGMGQAQEAQLRAQTLQRVEQGQPLTVADVQALVKAGVGDDLVISQIRNSRTVYYLTTADIIALKNSGVSEKAIDFMINTPTQIGSAQVTGVIGPPPPAPLSETIVVVPGPDYVWVGGVWVWLGDH